MEKINIVTLGGCAASDILRSNKNHVNLYNIDPWLGSVSRQSWAPDKVAARLKEEAKSIHDKAKNSSSLVNTEVQLFYTIKERRTPATIIDSLPENTVVILDPAYELMRFYFDGNEIFDIELNYKTHVRKHMPDWFNALIDKNTLRFDCGIKEIAKFQYRSIDNFMQMLDKRNIPTIAVDNLFTRKIYDPATNSTADAIPQWNSRMPFQWSSSNELENYEYANNLVSRFYSMFREKLPSNFKLFSPNVDKIYADLNHHLGYHPTHLHHTCRQLLNAELSALIVEALADHKKRQSLVLLDSIRKY